jgi:hypothetical protein
LHPFSLEGEGWDEGELIGFFLYFDSPHPNPLQQGRELIFQLNGSEDEREKEKKCVTRVKQRGIRDVQSEANCSLYFIFSSNAPRV